MFNRTMHPGPPSQPPLVYTPTTTSTVRPGFASRTAKTLGVAQVTLGVLSITIQVICILVAAGPFYLGTGIWTGVFMIIAGAFGIVSSQRKTNCFIITFMIMSIFASIAAFLLMLFSSLGIYLDIQYGRHHSDSFISSDATSLEGRLVLDSVMLILGVLEMVAAIWSSVICCKATCCLPGGGDPYSAPYHVQYIPATSTTGQQPVMLVSPPSGQPGVLYAIPHTQNNPSQGHQEEPQGYA